VGWIQKQDPYIPCLKETHRRPRDTYRWKVRGWEKVFHANRNQKKVGPAILIIRQNRLQYKWKNWAPREVEHLVQSHTDEMAGLGLKPMPLWTLELFRTHQNTSQAGRSRHNQQLITPQRNVKGKSIEPKVTGHLFFSLPPSHFWRLISRLSHHIPKTRF